METFFFIADTDLAAILDLDSDLALNLNPFPHGMFWTKVIYDLASSEPYSLSSLNSKNLKKYVHVRKGLGNTF